MPRYNARHHPEVHSGGRTAESVYAEFLASFEACGVVDGRVTPAEFITCVRAQPSLVCGSGGGGPRVDGTDTRRDWAYVGHRRCGEVYSPRDVPGRMQGEVSSPQRDARGSLAATP